MRGPEHEFELANPPFLKLIAEDPDEVLGKPARDVLPELEG
jgi:hypothetical protein